MTKYRIYANHKIKGSSHTFIVDGIEEVESFPSKYPKLSMIKVERIRKYDKTNIYSPKRVRHNLKARLCQIRGNLQSMTDSEESPLTQEEILQIQRISCQINRVISLFEMRTMDLHKEGRL